MTSDAVRAPPALLRNLRHNHVLHERVALLTILTEEPNVPKLLEHCRTKGFAFDLDESTFFLGRETLLATNRLGMAIWREQLFAAMSANAQRATQFYRIPPDHVIEIGAQIEL